MRSQIIGRLALAAILLLAWLTSAQQTGFKQVPYRGYLNLNGQPQSGFFDFNIAIQNLAGDPLWQDEFSQVMVTNGSFSLALGSGAELPADLWDNDDLYIQIGVRPASQGSFILLDGRQRLLALPYALRSNAAKNFHVAGSLDVAGMSTFNGEMRVNNLITRGRHDHVDNPNTPEVSTTYWDIVSTRYYLSFGYDFRDRSYQIPHSIIESYCGDEDGCRIKIGMTGWATTTTGTKAMTEYNLTYNTVGGNYRLESADSLYLSEGVDGDNNEIQLTCPWIACCLQDYARNSGNDTDDGEKSFFLYWATNQFDLPTRTCLVIIED